MAKITTSRPVDPAALKDALGVDVLTSGGIPFTSESKDVIVDGVTAAQLNAAVESHVYTPPVSVEPLTDDEITALRALLATGG